MSKEFIPLTNVEIEEIKKLAINARNKYGVNINVPISNDMVGILEKEGIILCEYPFEASEASHTDASITIFENGNEEITFIGLNTSLCYDEQIFALAHELYHFETRTGLSYNLNEDIEDAHTEAKADRFAAELLLPSSELQSSVVREFPDGIQGEVSLRLLRFIARLQCDWWLPYHSLVKRLFEESYVSDNVYNELYAINDRDENSEYARILRSIDCEKYELFNRKTQKINISASVLEVIIKNFEDGDIDESEFANILRLFNKVPEDLGYCMKNDDDSSDDDMEILY